MTRRNVERTLATALLTAALALPAAAQAPKVDPERAQALKEQAEALYDQPKEWGKVARLMEQSADLRAASDAEAYDCLVIAGRLRASLGDARAGQRLLERAAEHALARGLVLEAAEAFTDAAHAAARAGDANAVALLASRVRLLASSPALTAPDRYALLARIG